MVPELEIKKLTQKMEKGFAEMRALIMGNHPVGPWVKQEVACIMLNLQPRQLRNVRVHIDKNGNKVGEIRWRKGKGRLIEYNRADIEKYKSKFLIS